MRFSNFRRFHFVPAAEGPPLAVVVDIMHPKANQVEKTELIMALCELGI